MNKIAGNIKTNPSFYNNIIKSSNKRLSLCEKLYKKHFLNYIPASYGTENTKAELLTL